MWNQPKVREEKIVIRKREYKGNVKVRMENVNLNEACLLPPHVGGRLMLVSRYQVTIHKWRFRCVKNYNLQVVDQMCEKIIGTNV